MRITHPEIIYEDNHIIIINKPFGILSQGDSSGVPSLIEIIKEYIKNKYNKTGDVFLGLVHRLDRPVTGVMVFARTSKAASRLHSEIVSLEMEKYYISIVCKSFLCDDEWHKLSGFFRRERDTTYVYSDEVKGSQPGILMYRVIHSAEIYSLIIVKLITGRKHQIRSQFSKIGAPVAGDRKYGAENDYNGQIALHSFFLSFKHPTLKERIDFSSTPPEIFTKITGLTSQNITDRALNAIMELRDQADASK